jgi:hypothetical protein
VVGFRRGHVQITDAPGPLDFPAHPQHGKSDCQQDSGKHEPRPSVTSPLFHIRRIELVIRHTAAPACNLAATGDNAILAILGLSNNCLAIRVSGGRFA